MDRPLQVEGFGLQGQPFGLDLGVVQDVIDDDQQRLARGPDGVGKQPLLVRQGGLAQQFCHADDTVHRRADLVAHIGKEGRLGAVRGLCRLPGRFQGCLLFLGPGNVHAQADAPAIRCAVIMDAQPAPVPQLLLVHAIGLPVLRQTLGQPGLFAPHRIGMLAVVQTKAQDILEPGTGNHRRRRFGIDVAVALVAGQQAVVLVEQHETVRNGFDRGPDAHLFGDVDGKRHHVTIPCAAVHQPHPGVVQEFQDDRLDGITVPARHHGVDPGVHRQIARVDNGLLCRPAHDAVIAKPRRNGQTVEGGKVSPVGGDQPLRRIKHRKAVADRVDRIPQPPFGHDRRCMRIFQVRQKAAVLALQSLSFRQGGAHHLPLLDDLVGQGPGMQRQFFIGGEKFTLFLFQQPFRRKPAPPFLCKPLCDVHSTLCPVAVPSGTCPAGQSDATS